MLTIYNFIPALRIDWAGHWLKLREDTCRYILQVYFDSDIEVDDVKPGTSVCGLQTDHISLSSQSRWAYLDVYLPKLYNISMD